MVSMPTKSPPSRGKEQWPRQALRRKESAERRPRQSQSQKNQDNKQTTTKIKMMGGPNVRTAKFRRDRAWSRNRHAGHGKCRLAALKADRVHRHGRSWRRHG